MDLFTLLIILCLITAISAGRNNPSHLKPDVFVNCGSLGISTAINGKEWTGDKHQTIKGTSTTSSSTKKLTSSDPVIYKTARISHFKFLYTFHVNPGQIILRLHFNPTPYKGFTSFRDLFTAEAAQFILLKNFSASLTAQALGTTTFTKEFYLSVEENQPLNLIFSPTTTSPSQERTYAFVNGIEIISVTSHMSYFQNENLRAQVIGQKSMVYVDNKTALELIHRLNVKHESGSKTDEFDTVQIWKRSVHVGFRYLIRIHYSEIGLKIAEIGHLMFKVVINDHVVETSNDAVRGRHETAKIRYRDYLMVMKGQKEDGQHDLSISLESNNGHMDGYGILKGFEILKVSNPDNSLATPNPVPPERNDSSCMSLNFFRVMGPKDVIATIATMVIFVISIISYKLREMSEMENREEENKPSARAKQHCQRFSLAEIQLATRNFSDAFVIGRGGFGKVYKGNIDGGNEIVAIKRLNAYSSQGGREFLTEIETLSELRHINLVSLIGYCNERKEMILVYKYMKNGTLSDHLYKLERKNESSISLTWKQRLNICVGAGRGLEYLHTGHRVIHRDVKPSNILLDENFIAKVADFGLAKPEDRSELQSYVITHVKGTPGYLDPYYISDHRLTRKSDVYAFGVVLFEVLCGRPAVDQIAREEERFLTKWALSKIDKGEVNEILDSNLIEEILPDSLKVFVEVAKSCLHNEPNKRPTMAQVVVRLEFSLELQESGSFSTTQSKTGTDEEDTSSNDETFVHTHAPTDINIANSESTTETKYKQKNKTNRTRRFWPWDRIGKRSKPSKEEESVSQVLLEFRELGIEVRKFDIASIAYATNQFSTSNRTRELGYSTIYKAVLPTGQKLAVKRYSSSHSIPMLPAFKSEILSLSHVQHCNIIKLLGYCVSKEELMVVYEFMENQNLDIHLYDEAQRSLLHWDVRFKIIVGIAKGIIYLHQDSGMRIIHRDIKPSNISLDAHMNPKICDFSLAITFDDDQSDVETRIAGTIGFVDPDYMVSGIVSVMSDVYSFGVLILETVSGTRIWKQQGSDDSDDHNLVDYAWRLWKEGTALDLVDKSLNGSFSEDEALRCIQVGLLCIHREPHHRPTMPSALKMLLGDMAAYNPVLPVSWNESTLESNDTASASA